MAYLPLSLGEGLVMLYNIRDGRSLLHNYPSPDGFNWGSIYQISSYGINRAAVGQSVLYNGTDAVCILAVRHGKTQFPIIPEVRIVTTET